LKKQLSKEEFEAEFNNTVNSFRTLLCFSLQQENKTLWNLWGYAHNNQDTSHAEILVLREIEKYLLEKASDHEIRQRVTLYVTCSPCNRCCTKILEFFQRFQRFDMDIKISKIYDLDSLQDLKQLGVSLKVMDSSDFKECFDLFVHTAEEFEPWPGLEEKTKQLNAVFLTQLHLLTCLSEEEFYGKFNNTRKNGRNMLCFSLEGENKPIWKLWGYAHNVRSQKHAENIVLREVASYLTKPFLNHFYISYGPCSNCCDKILDFLQKFEKKIKIMIKIMISRLYKDESSVFQNSIKKLHQMGVSVQVMNRGDFEQCFKGFVKIQGDFQPWPALEPTSEKCAANLEAI
uniref:CMP/dCMP-type deaminase domain-containing protein n=1 Tax=Latimeria chalumnae TaxID=7897 RepID=H3B7Z9_LATCH